MSNRMARARAREDFTRDPCLLSQERSSAYHARSWLKIQTHVLFCTLDSSLLMRMLSDDLIYAWRSTDVTCEILLHIWVVHGGGRRPGNGTIFSSHDRPFQSIHVFGHGSHPSSKDVIVDTQLQYSNDVMYASMLVPYHPISRNIGQLTYRQIL